MELGCKPTVTSSGRFKEKLSYMRATSQSFLNKKNRPSCIIKEYSSITGSYV